MFIFPPHPISKLKITPEMLPNYEKQKIWLVQRKFNGSHCVIWSYQGKFEIWNREGEKFSNFQLSEEIKDVIGDFIDPDIEYVFDGELLHNKANIKNTIVLFDILLMEKHLINLTTLERIKLLQEIFPTNQLEPKGRAFLINKNFWLAETFFDEFSYHFWEFYELDEKENDLFPEIEGLMLKQINAKNTSVGSKPNEVDWMIRCRKKKDKIYQF